jgi:hypothetical protein
MPNKHKKTNHKKHKKTNNKYQETQNIYTSDTSSSMITNYFNKNEQQKPVCNSYPLSNIGYNFPNPEYSVQVIKRPDDNTYFNNYRYYYNVQVNKPTLTYDNFITQQKMKNMTEQEYRYYQQMNNNYFYFNGNYEVANDKPNKVLLQANLNYPMFSGGPATGEMNGQIGYTPQPTKSPNTTMVNSNDIRLNTTGVQVYGNSPAYYGVQANTVMNQTMITNNNNNNKSYGQNPAYNNYGQYYYGYFY